MNAAESAKKLRRTTYKVLMQGFTSSQQQNTEERWAWLMAAHIVGQHAFSLHWRNHVAMLRFALATRDYQEAAGQLFRLSLVPVGHVFQRLPVGNVGRATVNAFKPMTTDPALQRLIQHAKAKTVSACAHGLNRIDVP